MFLPELNLFLTSICLLIVSLQRAVEKIGDEYRVWHDGCGRRDGGR